MGHDIDLTIESKAGDSSRPRAWRGVGSGSGPEQLPEQRPAIHLQRPSKAEKVVVRRGMTVAQGFATIVCACIRHFQRNEQLVTEARSPEALHQVRVAMRRLRSAFSLFGPAIGDEQSARFREELRRFGAELGEARNLDVYLQRQLGRDERLAVEERREAAYDKVVLAMQSYRFRQLMLKLVSWSTVGDWRQARKARGPLRRFANRRIDRLWSKVSAARRLGRMDGEERHRLRIRVKKLRYAVEFVAALHSDEPGRRKGFRKAIRRLQDELGLLNDIAVARSLPGLNWWIADPRGSAADERTHVRESKAALRRMRRIGPYWRS